MENEYKLDGEGQQPQGGDQPQKPEGQTPPQQ